MSMPTRQTIPHGTNPPMTYMDSDERPGAICMGIIAILTLVGVVAVLVALDIPTYTVQILILKSNISHFLNMFRRQNKYTNNDIKDRPSSDIFTVEGPA